MIVRKIFLAIACILSGVAVFLPLITITLDGEAVQDGTAYLYQGFYGIAILVLDVVIILAALAGIKKGYVIASLINIGITIYTLIRVSIASEGISQLTKYTAKMATSMGTDIPKYDIVNGPAFFMLIFAAILILVTMLWNAINNDER